MTTDILAPARHVIGSRYVESANAYILELTGLERVKVVKGEVDTLENFSFQVRIYVDESGRISGLSNC